jgi:hypothetical protein
MNISLVTEQERGATDTNVKVRLAQRECLIGLAIRDELYDATDRNRDFLPLYPSASFAAKPKRDVGRVYSEDYQVVNDVDDLRVELLVVQVAGSQLDHVCFQTIE